MRDLIHEPFEHERVVRLVDRAPEPEAHADVFVDAGDAQVWNGITQVVYAFGVERRPARRKARLG
jgi:hypothetical protein